MFLRNWSDGKTFAGIGGAALIASLAVTDMHMDIFTSLKFDNIQMLHACMTQGAVEGMDAQDASTLDHLRPRLDRLAQDIQADLPKYPSAFRGACEDVKALGAMQAYEGLWTAAAVEGSLMVIETPKETIARMGDGTGYADHAGIAGRIFGGYDRGVERSPDEAMARAYATEVGASILDIKGAMLTLTPEIISSPVKRAEAVVDYFERHPFGPMISPEVATLPAFAAHPEVVDELLRSMALMNADTRRPEPEVDTSSKDMNSLNADWLTGFDWEAVLPVKEDVSEPFAEAPQKEFGQDEGLDR